MCERDLEWTPGKLVHAYTGKCLRCSSSDGDTIIVARVVEENGELFLAKEGAYFRCPQCRADERSKRHLSGSDRSCELSDKLFDGLPEETTWHPGDPLRPGGIH